MKRETVDLSALARFIADDLRNGRPARRALFRVHPGLLVQADPALLRVVLATLLNNAWKATRSSRPALIEIGAARQDGRLAFFVKDNGPGSEKTGMRLTFVECLLERHGGRLWGESQAGSGATFYFTV